MNRQITAEDREQAWGWNPAWGAQPLDQHVRARLMADDAAVLEQMRAAEAEAEFYATATAEELMQVRGF